MDSLNTTIVEFDIPHQRHRTLTLDEFLATNLDPKKIYWVHYHITSNGHLSDLAKKLNIPTETKRLCHQKSNFSKLIDDGESLTVKLFNFEVVSDQMDMKVRENHLNIYSEVTDVKHRVMEIKRCTVAIREILMRVSGRKITVISDDCRISLSNLFNQSQMIFNEIDSIRDMLNGMLSQMDYHLMHRMNNTMQILTAFAAIFLPLTLITGIYGMNFHNTPELNWYYGYYYALVLIVCCAAGLILLFKKMKWFN